ncbi:AAA family ATPase [Cellulosimicrobium funkei]|uniref:AAA family ATPase n=1 Tax=Cellulosimicrobium funkei TaxID=264251 RepID=UPI0034413BE7
MSVTGNALYADVAALLDNGIPDPPAPEILARTDGHALFYAGQVSLIFGDPESGKTWIALAAVAESLSLGRRALVLDLDHNGVGATINRLLDLGAPESALRDPERFRYAEPEDGAELLAVVRDCTAWQADVAVIDSLGEVVPLFGGSSNSPDDFTRVHSLIMKPLASSGAAVLCIDHLAKNTESRAMGSTGTAAKKRAIGGVSLRVSVVDAFTPGHGGAASITIAKDRHGGLRQHSPLGDKEPVAGTFRMSTIDDKTTWTVHAPSTGERNPAEAADPADVEALKNLNPPPRTVREARDRMNWRMERATAAMREFRALPVTDTGGAVTGNTSCGTCGEPVDPVLAASGFSHCEVAA